MKILIHAKKKEEERRSKDGKVIEKRKGKFEWQSLIRKSSYINYTLIQFQSAAFQISLSLSP